MFLTHFKLSSQPFAERIAADALWQDDRLRQSVARLRYLAEQATIGLLTGASGVGKSAVLKRFVHELPRPQFQPVYVHLTRLPSSALLKLVVTQLGEVPRRGKERLFEQILGKARQAVCNKVDPEYVDRQQGDRQAEKRGKEYGPYLA